MFSLVPLFSLILLGYVHSLVGWNQRHLGHWVDLCVLIEQRLGHSKSRVVNG